jgi:acetyl esterase/lipase
VRVVVSRPTEATSDLPAIVWIHGGGYVLGTVEMNQGFADQLVDELGAVVVSVDYRLAPETRAPGSVEDCYAALCWLHANAAELGIDPARIAIAGESAGGGLAAALGQLARDRGEIPVCLAALVYPMLDDRTAVTDDPNPYSRQYVWSPADNAFGWESVLGCPPGSAEVPPYASPARTEDLAGLSATFIGVGALDLFLDEDVEYARRLVRAGVPTELHVYPGAFHGFLGFADSGVSTALRTAMYAALRRAFS